MMALKGTLADLGIIDLVQIPHGGRKTGHLVISGSQGEAKLFYEDGSLVHASLGDISGMDALVRIVDWSEGEFEFIPDVEPEARSIDLDLHRAVMQALKIHDELKIEEETKRSQTNSGQGENDETLAAMLSEFLNSSDFALHASVLDSNGNVRASVDGPDGSPKGIEELQSNLYTLMQSHPRGGLNRILIDDNEGTVVLVRLGGERSLIVVASKDASLGAVTMSVGRLAVGLE
jgi:hypothetical protein